MNCEKVTQEGYEIQGEIQNRLNGVYSGQYAAYSIPKLAIVDEEKAKDCPNHPTNGQGSPRSKYQPALDIST